MENQVVVKKKGFSVLSLLLGILLGIILTLGAIVGVIYYVITADLNDVMDRAGLDNTDDDGNYVYINTDSENGGAKNLLELVSKVSALAGDAESLSIAKVENLVPAVSGMTDDLINAFSDYLDVDGEEVREVAFSEMGDWMVDTVNGIRVGRLLEKIAGEDSGIADNPLASALLYGVEADYVIYEGNKTPVWYDTYTPSGSNFVREGDGNELAFNLKQYLKEEGESNFRLYFFERDGRRYVVDNGEITNQIYAAYNSETCTLTGNYYYTSADEKHEPNPVTIGSLMKNPMGSVEKMLLTDLFKNPDDLLLEIMCGITLGQLIEGDVDFNEIVNGLELAKFVNATPEDSLMVYLLYGVHAITDTDGVYTGKYQLEEDVLDCVLEVDEEGNVSGAYYTVSDERVDIKGTGVNEINQRINDAIDTLTLIELMGNIDESDGIMWALRNSTVNSISEDVKQLTLEQVLGEIDEDNIIYSLKNSTLSTLAEDVNNITLNEFYAKDIYGDGEVKPDLKRAVLGTAGDGEISFSENYVYYTYDAETDEYSLVQVEGAELGKLTADAIGGPVEYYTYGAPVALWSLLICDNDNESVYRISEISKMINNIKENMQNATLETLVNAEIITMDEVTMSKKIVYYNGSSLRQSDETLGEMPLYQLINYVTLMAGDLPDGT